MEFVVIVLSTLLGQAQQAAEAATITISFGDALAGGAVGGGLPIAAVLSWLGIKRMKTKNGSNGSDTNGKIVGILTEISSDLKSERLLRKQQFELQQRQLDAMVKLETSGARVEDRLDLVREELRDMRDDIHNRH